MRVCVYIYRDAVERRRRRQPSSYMVLLLSLSLSSCCMDTCSQDNTLLLFKRTPATHSKSPAKNKNPTPIVNLYTIRLIFSMYIRQLNRKKKKIPPVHINRSKLMAALEQNRYHQSEARSKAFSDFSI